MAKPGRKSVGLSRPHITQVALNQAENEFVARLSFERGMSAATYGRISMLPTDWRYQLECLRREQKNAELSALDGRRK